MQTIEKVNERVETAFADSERIIRAAQRGVTAALDRHARLGVSVFIYRDGKMIEVPPAEIPALLQPK